MQHVKTNIFQRTVIEMSKEKVEGYVYTEKMVGNLMRE